MTLNRHRIIWNNFPGAPGYTNFFTGTAVTDSTPFKTFFTAAYNISGGVGAHLPNGTTMQFPTSGDQIEEATGKIVGAWSGTGPTQLSSSAAATNFAGGAGAQVQWLTSLIVNGRRVQGKTFLVPMLPSGMDQNGSISTTLLANISSAAQALIVALGGELKVFARPFTPNPATNPPVGSPGHQVARAGAQATVLNQRVPDIAVSLRSRRT